MKMYDVVIIGGGIIGVSIAYQLSKRGRTVALLEKDTVGAHASGAAGGMLGAQVEFAEPGPLVDLSLKSRAMFRELADELKHTSGIDIGLNEAGMLRIAWTEEEAAALQQRGRWQQTLGLRADWLERATVKEIEPEVSSDIAGALYLPDDTQVSAPDLTRAFAVAAARQGAEIMERCEVLHIEQVGGRVTGVVTADGTWAADQYVLAAGAWSGRIAHMLDLPLSVFPIKGEAFSVFSMRQPVQKTIYANGCYVVPKDGNRLLVGASSADCGFDSRLTINGLQKLMANALRLLPGLMHCPLEKTWASLRPQTADGMPYVGPSASHANLFVATGHYRNGILLSPLTGMMMADMLSGAKPDASLAPFTVQRAAQPIT
ncbi:glycine oxidase ThiO [Aneurinibacillus sp. BA2021]|nr:glycine oxidase ThiO [Aneurinibacillus sp. BA2021]